MPSTTVHLPDQLLSKIDQIVKEEGISRNRFIIQACERAVNDSAGRWPEGFFEGTFSYEVCIGHHCLLGYHEKRTALTRNTERGSARRHCYRTASSG